MTSIGAIIAQEQNGTAYQDEHIVFFSDSMGSAPDEGEKADNIQKLFIADNRLISVTGKLNVAHATIDELRTVRHATTLEVARHTRDLITGLPHDQRTNFLIGGVGGQTVELYHIGTFEHGQPPTIYRKTSAFDGSGSPYAQRRFDSYTERGSIRSVELADILSFAYETASRGATNAYANDKLQLGIVSEKGISLLMHPDTVMRTYKEYADYLKIMTGIEISYPDYESLDRDVDANTAAWNTAYERNDVATQTMHGVYRMALQDLARFTVKRMHYGDYAERMLLSDAYRPAMFTTLSDARDARKDLNTAIKAITARNIEAYNKYREEFATRQRRIGERAAALVNEQRIA